MDKKEAFRLRPVLESLVRVFQEMQRPPLFRLFDWYKKWRVSLSYAHLPGAP